MADDPKVAGQATDGGTGKPNPDPSQAAGTTVAGGAGQLSLESVKGVIREVLTEELKPIKGNISGLYSRQDKQDNAFRGFMDEYNKNKAKGLSDDDAFTATETTLESRAAADRKDKMIEEIHARLVGSSPGQAAGNGATGADAQAKVIAELGLDPKDATTAAKIAEELKAPATFRENMAVWVATNKRPSPNSAQLPVHEGGGAGGEDQAAKEKRLNELAKDPVHNAKEIKDLKKELGWTKEK